MALSHFHKAIDISLEIGDKRLESVQIGAIGNVYAITGEYNIAEKMLRDSRTIDSEIGYQRAKGAHLGSS